MNRNEFLATLGLGGIGLALESTQVGGIKKILDSSKGWMNDYIDPMEWFKENKEWMLKSWFVNPCVYNDPEGKCKYGLMQIFKSWVSGTDVATSEKYSHKIGIDKLREVVLYSAVFGVQRKICENFGKWTGSGIQAYPEGTGVDLSGVYPRVRYMGGFIQQTGRYPTKGDKARFVYLAGNGISRWEQQYNDWMADRTIYLSECRLEV